MTAEEAIKTIYLEAAICIQNGQDVNAVELYEICRQVLHHGGKPTPTEAFRDKL